MPAERMQQPGTVSIRHAREATCKVVEDLHTQGALAVEEIGPEHEQSHYRTLHWRVYILEMIGLEHKGLRKVDQRH